MVDIEKQKPKTIDIRLLFVGRAELSDGKLGRKYYRVPDGRKDAPRQSFNNNMVSVYSKQVGRRRPGNYVIERLEPLRNAYWNLEGRARAAFLARVVASITSHSSLKKK